MPAASTDRMFIGDRLGNYRIELELASAGPVTTYRAAHVVLPRRALIKMVHGHPERPRVVRLLREACILDALHHPGVLRVYDSGLQDGQPWLATELLEGHTLHGALVAAGSSDRIAVVRDLAEVLEHAWSRGIVHCGLRPERILMTGRTRGYPLCVVDWSDARAHDAAPQRVFPCQAAWHYTAPELAAGDPLDDRTDVFALGVLAYQLLAGRQPFERGVLADASAEHVPTARLAPELPGALAHLIDRMVARRRDDRPRIADVCGVLDELPEQAAHAPGPGVRIRRPRWTPELAVTEEPPPRRRAERSRTMIGIPILGDLDD